MSDRFSLRFGNLGRFKMRYAQSIEINGIMRLCLHLCLRAAVRLPKSSWSVKHEEGKRHMSKILNEKEKRRTGTFKNLSGKCASSSARYRRMTLLFVAVTTFNYPYQSGSASSMRPGCPAAGPTLCYKDQKSQPSTFVNDGSCMISYLISTS